MSFPEPNTDHDLDYRIPQMLNQLGCLRYAPPLENHIRSLRDIQPGSKWEIEMRGTSIWCVELIKREIEKRHPEVKTARRTSVSEPEKEKPNEEESAENGEQPQPRRTYGINAILIDFFLYDTMKGLEEEKNESLPHHRTRSIWY